MLSPAGADAPSSWLAPGQAHELPLAQGLPAEQARIVRLLVQRVQVGPTGAEIRLRLRGCPASYETSAALVLTPGSWHGRGSRHHCQGTAGNPQPRRKEAGG